MDPLRTSVLQTHYPPNRRKNVSTVDSFLKQIGGSFLTFLDQQQSPSVSPSKRKTTINNPQQSIRFHYKKIHDIIENIDHHIVLRLQHHQNEVFSIVKQQIQDMRQETQQMIEKLNQTIKNKNAEDQIWKLGNELDYFKSQTFKLFQDNKLLRKSNAELKRKIKESDIQRQNDLALMEKMKRKLIKNDLLLKKTSQIKGKVKKGKLNGSESSNQIHHRNTDLKKIVKTEFIQIQPQKQQSGSANLIQQSTINIKLDKQQSRKWPKKQAEAIEQDEDPLADAISIPSYTIHKKRTGDTPKARITQIDTSYVQEQPLQSSRRDKSIQTQTFQLYPEIRCEKIQVDQFSKTSGINYPNVRYKKSKQIDLIKNGFHVRSYNQRSTTLGSRQTQGLVSASPLLLDQPQQNPYVKNISKVFKNNRIATQIGKDQRGRISTMM